MENQFAPIERARPGSFPVDSDSQAAVSGGDRTDDLLTRAVTEALAAGMSWAQIAVQLGVPPPAAHAAVTDHDWQEAIVAHENARAARLNARACPGAREGRSLSCNEPKTVANNSYSK